MALGATNRRRGPLSNAVALGTLGLCLLTAAPAWANGELDTGVPARRTPTRFLQASQGDRSPGAIPELPQAGFVFISCLPRLVWPRLPDHLGQAYRAVYMSPDGELTLDVHHVNGLGGCRVLPAHIQGRRRGRT